MKRIAFLALIAAGVFWGLGFPLGKFAMQEAPAAHTVLLRFVVASLAALPFALASAQTRALFRSPVVLVAGVLVDVRRDQHGETLDLGRQRDRPAHLSAGAPGGLDDFPRRLIDQPVIERLEADADTLAGSRAHGAHSMILATTSGVIGST